MTPSCRQFLQWGVESYSPPGEEVWEAVFRIRIHIPNVDPDPAADKISSKSQKNSYHLELFD